MYLTREHVSGNVLIRTRQCSQVRTHDDEESIQLRDLFFQELCIFEGLSWVVNRAWTDDDDESVILAGNNPRRSEASMRDRGLGGRSRGDFMSNESGLYEGVVLNVIECRE